MNHTSLNDSKCVCMWCKQYPKHCLNLGRVCIKFIRLVQFLQKYPKCDEHDQISNYQEREPAKKAAMIIHSYTFKLGLLKQY